jgi:hypothetical protein
MDTGLARAYSQPSCFREINGDTDSQPTARESTRAGLHNGVSFAHSL